MTNPFQPRIGGTLSADIAVPEHERVTRFYVNVLTTGEKPLWREDLMNNLGMPVIGLGKRSEEYAMLPLQWMPHIQVEDVAKSVERAITLDGTDLMHGKDDNGESQWAVMLDPSGAAFGLIPIVTSDALPPEASEVSAESPDAGCISWLDLTVPDAPTIRDFYREVIGWSVEDVAMEDAGEKYADFNMLGGDGGPAAGVCHARGVNSNLPAIWMLYLPVGDLAESIRRTEENGGKVIKKGTGPDGKLTHAVIEDPVGVAIALVPGA